MSDPLRRGGTFLDADERTVIWSVAEGRRGSRWRWTVGDGRGAIAVGHTLEIDPDGRFARLESASGMGLLTLHRESDGSVHGNRVTDGGVEHLTIPAPAPDLALVGSGQLGVAALVRGLALDVDRRGFDVLEVGDDLGVTVVSCSVVLDPAGAWEVRTDHHVRRGQFDPFARPAEAPSASISWPLE